MPHKTKEARRDYQRRYQERLRHGELIQRIRYSLECKRCEFKWRGYSENPKNCRRCGSPYWNREGQQACKVRTHVNKMTPEQYRERLRERHRGYNKKRFGPHNHWGRHLRYGLTWNQYQGKLAEQENACAICHREFQSGHTKLKPYIDHDHQTNMVRSLLCGYCNSAIGLLQDNPDLLRAAADYLERAKFNQTLEAVLAA